MSCGNCCLLSLTAAKHASVPAQQLTSQSWFLLELHTDQFLQFAGRVWSGSRQPAGETASPLLSGSGACNV